MRNAAFHRCLSESGVLALRHVCCLRLENGPPRPPLRSEMLKAKPGNGDRSEMAAPGVPRSSRRHYFFRAWPPYGGPARSREALFLQYGTQDPVRACGSCTKAGQAAAERGDGGGEAPAGSSQKKSPHGAWPARVGRHRSRPDCVHWAFLPCVRTDDCAMRPCGGRPSPRFKVKSWNFPEGFFVQNQPRRLPSQRGDGFPTPLHRKGAAGAGQFSFRAVPHSNTPGAQLCGLVCGLTARSRRQCCRAVQSRITQR